MSVAKLEWRKGVHNKFSINSNMKVHAPNYVRMRICPESMIEYNLTILIIKIEEMIYLLIK